ncbi:MAG: c-type cytochrome [Verrucomicrobia bacterium]|nr:c-type cytochrome [Verrucomicrobiota bacterium]
MKRLSRPIFVFLGLFTSALRAAEWYPVLVPGSWEENGPAAAHSYDGIAWYRTWVKVPDSFFKDTDKYEEIKYAETVGVVIRDLADAHEVYVNGVRIGVGGEFPPDFKSGRNVGHRHRVPVGTLGKGAWNEIAIRVHNQSGPGGFLGGAPRIMNIMNECVLEGRWEFFPGDGYRPGRALASRPAATSFDQFQASNFVLGRLAQLDPGPRLSPQDSLAKMNSADDLKVELVLSEPLIAQPTHMSFDARGRLWVAQYRQYPYPAGLEIIGRSPGIEAIFDRVPPAPPHHDRGADIISIHDDTDGDGVFDKHTVFQDGLNMANSVVRGRGGVWVMNTPYVMFYPDQDFDDVPDGPPVVHLQGFGLEDTHAVSNGLIWGPDGWLYGGQGSTTTSRVTRPGLDGPDVEGVYFDGSMVWRYHPETRAYEIFAKGGGNTFGLEFDGQGRLYSGHNGGQTRGFHYVQGGYFTLQRPGPNEMYAFGQLPYMSTLTPVRRFSHFGAFVEGTALPANYQGHLFAIDPLHNEVLDVHRSGLRSTFETRDVGRPMWSDDVAFRPLHIVNAPDGSLFVSDMYEYYTAHRNHYQSQIDPDTGRIYRLRGKDSAFERDTNLEKKSTGQLMALLAHPNKWHRQMAVHLLGERKDPSAVATLEHTLAQDRGLGPLNALWALHQMGSLEDRVAQSALRHPYPAVRMWAVRLLGDKYGVNRGLGRSGPGAKKSGDLPADVMGAVLAQAAREPEAEVRAQFASTARRLATAQALRLVGVLAAHDGDVTDPNIPPLVWWVLEAHAGLDRERVVTFFRTTALWERPLVQQHLLPRLMRRFALEGRRQDLIVCAQLLRMAPTPQHTVFLMKGFEEAYRGRELVDLPDELSEAMAASGQTPLILRVRQGDAAAVKEAMATVRNKQAPLEERLLYTRAFGEVRRDFAVPALFAVAAGPEPPTLRRTAVVSLMHFDQAEIGPWAAALLPKTTGDIRTAILALLSSRAAWARHLLGSIESGQIAAADIPPDIVDRMRGHQPVDVAELVAKVFPPVAGNSAAHLNLRIAEVEARLKQGTGNAKAGGALFTQRCANCHTLFHKGGRLGPDLTDYQRDNLGTMLPSIINPSAEIREGFQYYLIATHDGRSLSGFLVKRDLQIVVVRGFEGEDITLRQSEIKSLQAVGRSLMPEGLLDDMDAQQLRDLFAYLRSPRPR